jgi:glycosyltransferase involved in cell wall biosynthesis
MAGVTSPPASRPATQRRVTLVASQILGYDRTGGLGTATSLLAAALSRAGHDVSVLYAGEPRGPLEPRWAARYDRLGIPIRHLGPEGAVRPEYLELQGRVLHALLADPPDLVVAQDLGGPTALAERQRRLGLGFPDTIFAVHCHGTSRWTADASNKLPTTSGRLATELLEQEAIERADVLVSPSAYMLRWMREAGWTLPEATCVLPYLTTAVALAEPLPEPLVPGGPIRRIAFFGRLDERKGIGPFVAGVSALDPALLAGIELVLLGGPSPRWPPERVRESLPSHARVRIEPELDHGEVLAELARPGTVAVMPSLADNSPHTVIECLERRIPFLASLEGGTGELIAVDDQVRVALEPTPEGIRAALCALLEVGTTPAPARPSADPEATLAGWLELVAEPPPARHPALAPSSRDEWTLHSAPADEFMPGAEERLRAAQVATGADVVTCGVDIGGEPHLFLGEPGALALLENAYGQAGLVRRSLLAGEQSLSRPARDPDWPFLAGLSVRGATIVSVPEPLVRHGRPIGTIASDPAGSVRVLQLFERALPDRLCSVARLAALLGYERSVLLSAAPEPGRRNWRPLAGPLRRAASRIASRTGGK